MTWKEYSPEPEIPTKESIEDEPKPKKEEPQGMNEFLEFLDILLISGLAYIFEQAHLHEAAQKWVRGQLAPAFMGILAKNRCEFIFSENEEKITVQVGRRAVNALHNFIPPQEILLMGGNSADPILKWVGLSAEEVEGDVFFYFLK
jgi:hypothetical protein